MLPSIQLLLLIGALVCFALAAWEPGHPTWNRRIGTGLALLTAAMLTR